MATRDPYEVLGVPKDADANEIKSAYRRLARRFHPDVNQEQPDAEERFKEIGEAYGILSDPERRARYDRFGTADEVPFDPFQGVGGFGDIFEMMFGGMQGAQRRTAARNGEDLRADVVITMSEVLTGAHRDLDISRPTECEACHGTGAEGGKPPETCGTCKGAGIVSQIRQTFLGQMTTSTTCPTCGGAGSIIRDPCKVCRGRRLTTVKSRVQISIPAGVESGSTMHVPGQGGDGVLGGRPGDLYVMIEVKDEPNMARQGTTLFARLDLTYAQAALGDTLAVPGLDEELEVHVPPGTQPGERLVLHGHGLPPLHGGRRGDFVLQAAVKVPKKLTDEQAAALRGLADAMGEPQPKGKHKGGILGDLFGKSKS